MARTRPLDLECASRRNLVQGGQAHTGRHHGERSTAHDLGLTAVDIADLIGARRARRPHLDRISRLHIDVGNILPRRRARCRNVYPVSTVARTRPLDLERASRRNLVKRFQESCRQGFAHFNSSLSEQFLESPGVIAEFIHALFDGRPHRYRRALVCIHRLNKAATRYGSWSGELDFVTRCSRAGPVDLKFFACRHGILSRDSCFRQLCCQFDRDAFGSVVADFVAPCSLKGSSHRPHLVGTVRDIRNVQACGLGRPLDVNIATAYGPADRSANIAPVQFTDRHEGYGLGGDNLLERDRQFVRIVGGNE